MKLSRALGIASLASLLSFPSFAADDYKPGPDSLPQPGVPKGEMLKDKHIAAENSVFPGTEREYQIYLPAGFRNADTPVRTNGAGADKSVRVTNAPAPFMVFQDGVIYQAPTVFDNLIAKKEIPPLIGIFIKPGVVPASNDNALPRFNRSYEYDSVTDNYSRFLIEGFLPAIAAKHKLNLSADPNARGIAGSSSGGICAFMVAWHRPDSFRRVFTSVGTYVGIHGADQLPVLVRKYEPKPIRIYLQSGENDNNLYCGDWWMANQMMERSLTWNGYDVNHTWGTGGHNQKHATAIFPDVLRWLWKGYPDEPVKANPRGDAKWRGYEVIVETQPWVDAMPGFMHNICDYLAPDEHGSVFFTRHEIGGHHLYQLGENGSVKQITRQVFTMEGIAVRADGKVLVATTDYQADNGHGYSTIRSVDANGDSSVYFKRPQEFPMVEGIAVSQATGSIYLASNLLIIQRVDSGGKGHLTGKSLSWTTTRFAISPDQSLLYFRSGGSTSIGCFQIETDGSLVKGQWYFELQGPSDSSGQSVGMCVDTNGWLYVATSLGIQVCDQAGRVNFIIPTPQQPHDVCFGGKDLSGLFIACGDTIYKRQTKAHGYISGQMAPIKPPPPKL